MITNQPGIELVDVRLDNPRGGEPLLSEANIRVTGGERVLIVGAAGHGTSRLVASVLGEAAVSAGRVEVLGHDVAKLRRSSLRLLRRRVGIVPQDLCLLDDRSAQLNVVLPLEIDGIPRSVSAARGAEVLAQLGLCDEAALPAGSLSMAARQRVAVARALVRDPALLIADHPTSAQDAAGTDLVCRAIADAASRGAACVVFSRDPALRVIAERERWRQMAIVQGTLRPLIDVSLAYPTIEDLFVDTTAPPSGSAASAAAGLGPAPARLPDATDKLAAKPAADAPSNVLPFPIARPAGAR